jgi:protein MpaA
MRRGAVLVAATAVLVVTPAIASVREVQIGRSVEGRPLRAVELGDRHGRRKVLVVGCVHGDECAGVAIVDALERLQPPAGVDLWLVADLNPDGARADTRQNAHGVDLNRNFPWDWRHLDGAYDSGPRPLSEPESRAASRLILRVRPQISIWFHQHEGVVDTSGGDVAVERRFSRLVGLPLRRLSREPGSAVGWENHHLHGGTAFVVELRAGVLPTASAFQFARAVLAVANGVARPEVSRRPRIRPPSAMSERPATPGRSR